MKMVRGNYSKIFGVENKKISIAVISNKMDLVRNYSEFVDSCDLVFRSGKMCNIDSGKSGTRIDLVLLPLFSKYYCFSRKRRHIKEIQERAKYIGLFNRDWQFREANNYFNSEKLSDIPVIIFPKGGYYDNSCTTINKLLYFAVSEFPLATVYFLGDISCGVRIDWVNWHNIKEDDEFIREAINIKRIVHILEDGMDDCDCVYSTIFSEN